MQRIRMTALALAIPALAVLAMSGCGGGDSKSTDKPSTSGASTSSGGDKKDTGKSSSGKEEVASTGWGTIKGKVVLDGTPPTPAPLEITKDQDHCSKGPKSELLNPTWIVGQDKGVANVIVWLQAPTNKYFAIPDDQKTRKDTVLVQQPYCAFEPHVFVLYPSFYDAASKSQKRTGQQFKVNNTAAIAHNTNYSFSDQLLNTGDNKLLPPLKAGDKPAEIDVTANAAKEKDCSKVQDIKVACNIHPWMSAYGKVFDHPFAAVTGGAKEGDKAFGEFVIANAPAGAEVDLMYWHESMSKPEVAKKVTLKDKGEVTETITIKK